MPKLEKFKREADKPTTKHILISAGIIIGLLAIFVVYKSFALYTDKKTHDVIKSRIGSFDQEDMVLTYTIDGVKNDLPFPKKINGYIANGVTCQNGVTASWDSESWGLVNINANSQTKIKCNIDFDGDTWEFGYIGDAQEFIAPKNGTYKIELWGASGSESSSIVEDVGLGGYVSGDVELNATNNVYIYIGGNTILPYTNSSKMVTYNGGGAGQAAGGGASDARLVNGNWDNFNSLKSRVIVAGGGGGGFTNWSITNKVLGHAGGLEGHGASCTYYPESSNLNYSSGGGTQTSGGIGGQGISYNGNDRTNATGKFGYGGYAFDTRNSTYTPIASGGGGGYYGGGHGTHPGNGFTGGGGGSSFISGYSGCNAIDSTSTENNIVHKNTPNHDDMTFTNGVMIDGAGCNWSTGSATNCGANQPQPDGTYATGHSGNGYARITLIS